MKENEDQLTVGMLIDMLKQHPEDALVFMDHPDCDGVPVGSVEGFWDGKSVIIEPA